jgi:hypothetical protein
MSKPSEEVALGGCFGTADGKFARHDNDEARAKEWVAAQKASGQNAEQILGSVEAYLRGRNVTAEHMKQELDFARKKIALWYK